MSDKRGRPAGFVDSEDDEDGDDGSSDDLSGMGGFGVVAARKEKRRGED